MMTARVSCRAVPGDSPAGTRYTASPVAGCGHDDSPRCDWCDRVASFRVNHPRDDWHDHTCTVHLQLFAGELEPMTATRTTRDRAAAHFHAGGVVLVSTSGAASFDVWPSTVTHAGDATAWRDLVATVTSYGDPRQAYYVVGDPR